MGSSIALHLAAMSEGKRIVVIERDSSHKWSSAPRSAGGIRQQFSERVNIELSLYGVDFLKHKLASLCEGIDVDTDVQFRENGYLLLATPGAGEATLRENVAVQWAAGADWIELLEPDALKRRFPWLSLDDISLGSFGTRNEGYFDPWALLQVLKKASIARGVEFVEAEVTGLDLGLTNRIQSISTRSGASISADIVINAAGAFSGRVVGMCGSGVTPLPVVPRKRCMFAVRTSAESSPPENTPLTIDPCGVYHRSEGSKGRFVCGVSPRPEDDPDNDKWEDLETVDHSLFEETIWPALAERVPAFEALRVESSWAGFYEYNTLDQNGIVGWHPDVPNMLVASGFSGHGLQQSPGVGLACAELIAHGGYKTIDLTSLGYERIVRGEPFFEKGIY